jgi:hypothetical protein
LSLLFYHLYKPGERVPYNNATADGLTNMQALECVNSMISHISIGAMAQHFSNTTINFNSIIENHQTNNEEIINLTENNGNTNFYHDFMDNAVNNGFALEQRDRLISDAWFTEFEINYQYSNNQLKARPEYVHTLDIVSKSTTVISAVILISDVVNKVREGKTEEAIEIIGLTVGQEIVSEALEGLVEFTAKKVLGRVGISLAAKAAGSTLTSFFARTLIGFAIGGPVGLVASVAIGFGVDYAVGKIFDWLTTPKPISMPLTNASPLVLDLNNNGIETLNIAKGVYFDHDDNGFSEKTGWIEKSDAFLAIDIDNNGSIDSGNELF